LNQDQENHSFFTKKGKDLYLIWTQWPNQEFRVTGISGEETTRVSLLGYSSAVEWKKTEKGVLIIPPDINPSTEPCDYAWTFKISCVFGNRN